MSDRVTSVRYGKEELMRRLKAAVWSLSGRGSQETADGLKARLAVVFFSKVKAAFVVKARGGTDEAGISWPPLNPKTLAYSRRGTARRTTQAQQRQGHDRYIGSRAFKQEYQRNLARLALTEQPIEARRRATAIAIVAVERAGKSGPTKISVARMMSPGTDYDILRDTGILFNSLQPGMMTGGSYTPPAGQTFRSEPGLLALGTNVEYAGTHHYGRPSGGIPQRALWPEPDNVPLSWQQAASDSLMRGMTAAIEREVTG